MELTPWFHRDQSGRRGREREDRLVGKNSSKMVIWHNIVWTIKLKVNWNHNYVNYVILRMTDVVNS